MNYKKRGFSLYDVEDYLRVAGAEKINEGAGEHGYGDFQMFTSNPRSWNSKPLDVDKVELFKEYCNKYDTIPFSHLPYLFNLASPSEEQRMKSLNLLNDNLKRCDLMDIKYIVVHIGSHLGTGVDKGISRITDAINDNIIDHKVMILFENGAGYNNSVGSNMDEINEIFDKLNSDNIGLCLDTCHAFAAGYDLRDPKKLDLLVDDIKNLGKDKLKLVHLNDAKYELGSGMDRHEHLGKGKIGEEGFINFFSNPFFQKGCFVMETPVDELGNDYDYNEVSKIISKVNKQLNLDINFR